MLFVDIHKKLDHFSLHATFALKNEIAVLLGPSGAGKTTILNSLAGITKPDGGLIKCNNLVFFEGGKINLPTKKRKIGYLFQDYALFPHMTVEKNILYGTKSTATRNLERVHQLIDVLGIGHLLLKYPGQISGGEKQRAALARALAAEPQLLLLDEPFSALDNNTRIRCQNELLQIHQTWKIPIVFVTHDIQEAEKLANKILTMEDGKINIVQPDQPHKGTLNVAPACNDASIYD